MYIYTVNNFLKCLVSSSLFTGEMAQAKPSVNKIKKKRTKMKYPDEMYQDFDEVIWELSEMNEIFVTNFLYDGGRWIELRTHSIMFGKIWDTPLRVLEYCYNDISHMDAIIISQEWKKHKKKYKRLTKKK